MKVAHVLRKCNPDEWGGTESHLLRLVTGLAHRGVESVLFSPRLAHPPSAPDPFERAGIVHRRFRAVLPVLGIDEARRAQAIAIGGNLLSFDLPFLLLREPGLDLVHTHTLNRLGGVARTVARLRRIPYVVSIHGGVTTLSEEAARCLAEATRGGLDWGRPYGLLFGSRRVIADADAVITFNAEEGARLGRRHPGLRVVTLPHGVPVEHFEQDHREAALQAFPDLRGRRVLLSVGRVDPVKNQAFLVEQMPRVVARFPEALLVLVGHTTDTAYAEALRARIATLGLSGHVRLVQGMSLDDERLVGLYQVAEVFLLASSAEVFGLVLLEAWAAGTPVLASRTPGTESLVSHGEDGFLYEVNDPAGFHAALGRLLEDPALCVTLGMAGKAKVRREYDLSKCVARVHALYEEVLQGRRR